MSAGLYGHPVCSNSEWWCEASLMNLKYRWWHSLHDGFLSSFPSICVFWIAKHIRLDSECMIVSSDACIEQYATVQINSQESGKNEVVFSLKNSHFIFSLAYLADIFQQLNKVDLKLQGKRREIVNFIDTSVHSWKNFTFRNEKLKQEILLCSRFCHGDW